MKKETQILNDINVRLAKELQFRMIKLGENQEIGLEKT
jgi:hypothetical protein